MFFWWVFLKTHKKSDGPSKRPFWQFLAVNSGFLCIFKNTDQNNICASIAFEVKTKENMQTNFFYGFYFKTQNALFRGSTNFFSVLAFKTIDTQMLF